MKRRPFQPRFLWPSVLLGLIPFLLFRLVIFYEVTFQIGSYVKFPGILVTDTLKFRSDSKGNVVGAQHVGSGVGLTAQRANRNVGSDDHTSTQDDVSAGDVQDPSLLLSSQAFKQKEESDEGINVQSSEAFTHISAHVDGPGPQTKNSVSELSRKARDAKEYTSDRSHTVGKGEEEEDQIRSKSGAQSKDAEREHTDEDAFQWSEENELVQNRQQEEEKIKQKAKRSDEKAHKLKEVEEPEKKLKEKEEEKRMIIENEDVENERKFDKKEAGIHIVKEHEDEERKINEEGGNRKSKEREAKGKSKEKKEEDHNLKEEEEERTLLDGEDRKLNEEEQKKIKDHEEERKVKEKGEGVIRDEGGPKKSEKREQDIQDEEDHSAESKKKESNRGVSEESEDGSTVGRISEVITDAQTLQKIHDKEEKEETAQSVEDKITTEGSAEHESSERRKDERKEGGEDSTGSQDDNQDEKQGGSVPAEVVITPEEMLTQLWNNRPGDCNLHDGAWEYDEEEPLYTNKTCAHIQGDQDCIANGRPDTIYLHWKWKPRDCDLPRFDAEAFMKAFRGKTIGFVGDSLARNQMQSLLCMLAQVEKPTLIYDNYANVKWIYQQYQVTLLVVWSPYLLKHSTEPLKEYNLSSVLYLDVLDTTWTSKIKELDIIVLSIGQWYFKPSVYVREDTAVGCHYCPDLNLTELGFFDIYRDALYDILDKVASDMKGIAIMSTFAISHFENGPWENGGDCRRERPVVPEEMPLFGGMHDEMRAVVLDAFTRSLNSRRQGDGGLYLDFLDVTRVSLLRADGHPGPYRRPHPYAHRNSSDWIINDCLHWCLPGPVDTWNQLLVKIAHRYL